MPSGFVVRFSPAGPWRFGPDSGERDRVESVLHSDALYAAVSSAMARMGSLEEWIEAAFTSESAPAVRFSSCFPCQGEVLFVIPPATVWPPPASVKVRWKGARFVPLSVVEQLLSEQPLDEDQWRVDGPSQCLIPASWERGPFRRAIRSNAAVDRMSGQTAVHRTACLEFSPDAGMWALVSFAGAAAEERWSGRVQGALRLLADSGLGGERSRGWGRSEQPVFQEVAADSLLSKSLPGARIDSGDATPLSVVSENHWLLSLFSPGDAEGIDWSRGDYALLTRGGRTGSLSAAGLLKKHSRMVAEGSVLVSGNAPGGVARDVAPANCAHPVYRAGFALTVPLPSREGSR